jgi:hypothetical protein
VVQGIGSEFKPHCCKKKKRKKDLPKICEPSPPHNHTDLISCIFLLPKTPPPPRFKILGLDPVWWCTFVIPAIRRLNQKIKSLRPAWAFKKILSQNPKEKKGKKSKV